MFQEFKNEIDWGGRKLVLETGKVARQADGAVLATYGETKVLCTVVGETSPRLGIDFFPLSVHYVEKAFAAGKIPGGFFKREGRPSEKETLTSRLIDRPIRPLFEKGYKNETQVICTVLSHDLENDPDIVSLVGASAALTISGIPFLGPIGGARVGYIGGEYVLNPITEDLEKSDLDMIVAGTGQAVLMVESEANELSEEIMLGAVMFAHKEFQPVIQAIIELAEDCAKEPWDIAEPPSEADDALERVRDVAEADSEVAIPADENRIARLYDVGAGRFHGAGAGGRYGHGHAVLRVEYHAQHLAHVIHDLEERRVQVTHYGKRQGLQYPGVHGAWSGAQQHFLRGLQFFHVGASQGCPSVPWTFSVSGYSSRAAGYKTADAPPSRFTAIPVR